MARFAGQALQTTPTQQKPVLPSFNAEDLIETPEMRPGPYYPGQDLDRDKYIRQQPGSGVASIEGQQLAFGPAVVPIVKGVGTAIKGYQMYRAGKSIGNGIRDPQSQQGGGITPGSIVADMTDGKREAPGSTLRSPYHQYSATPHLP